MGSTSCGRTARRLTARHTTREQTGGNYVNSSIEGFTTVVSLFVVFPWLLGPRL